MGRKRIPYFFSLWQTKMKRRITMRTTRLGSLFLVLVLACMGFDTVTPLPQGVAASSSKSAASSWVKIYHQSGLSFAPEIASILPDADGSLVLVGYDWTSNFMDSAYLPLAVKMDGEGEIAWYQYLWPSSDGVDRTGAFTQAIPGNDGGTILSAYSSKESHAQVAATAWDGF
jgi:hypothetical protein